MPDKLQSDTVIFHQNMHKSEDKKERNIFSRNSKNSDTIPQGFTTIGILNHRYNSFYQHLLPYWRGIMLKILAIRILTNYNGYSKSAIKNIPKEEISRAYRRRLLMQDNNIKASAKSALSSMNNEEEVAQSWINHEDTVLSPSMKNCSSVFFTDHVMDENNLSDTVKVRRLSAEVSQLKKRIHAVTEGSLNSPCWISGQNFFSSDSDDDNLNDYLEDRSGILSDLEPLDIDSIMNANPTCTHDKEGEIKISLDDYTAAISISEDIASSATVAIDSVIDIWRDNELSRTCRDNQIRSMLEQLKSQLSIASTNAKSVRKSFTKSSDSSTPPLPDISSSIIIPSPDPKAGDGNIEYLSPIRSNHRSNSILMEARSHLRKVGSKVEDGSDCLGEYSKLVLKNSNKGAHRPSGADNTSSHTSLVTSTTTTNNETCNDNYRKRRHLNHREEKTHRTQHDNTKNNQNVCSVVPIRSTSSECDTNSKLKSLQVGEGKPHKRKIRNRIGIHLNLIKLIGRGSTGVVYLAELTKRSNAQPEIVAVKRLKGAAGDAMSDIIEKEVSILRRLHHPNVICYRGVRIKKKQHVYDILLEYMDNGSISDQLKYLRDKDIHGFTEKEIIPLVFQILSGLLYLHKTCNIIHRDIKPSNILLNQSGEVKIADFDVSTHVAGMKTMKRTCVGTPYYTSPEVIQMEPYSYSCDIWSLGCMVVEMVDGRPPYYSMNPMAAMFAMVKHTSPDIPRYCRSNEERISDELYYFMAQCLQRDARKRPTCDQLIQFQIFNEMYR